MGKVSTSFSNDDIIFRVSKYPGFGPVVNEASVVSEWVDPLWLVLVLDRSVKIVVKDGLL